MKRFWFLLLFACQTLNAQDFEKGYRMLEAGKFAEGAAFFKSYLQNQDATNRTALLCYGRGIGLSDSPTAAQGIFKQLLQRFPNDLEVRLNWIESLMWNKQFDDARAEYEQLLAQYPTNFAALLGCANALSSLGLFEDALAMVQRAQIVDNQNSNIAITRKYARLGWANQLAQRQQYTKAVGLLESILVDFPQDNDATFLKGQVMTFQENYETATSLFKKLLNTPKQTDALLQLSYLAFMQKDPKKALLLAEKAHNTATATEKIRTALAKINALGWNNRFAEAFAELKKIEKQQPKNSEITILKARLSVWGKHYERGVSYYKQALKQNPRSFDANLGFADVKHAQGMDDVAYQYANRTLKLFPQQADAERFIEKLNLMHAPSVESHVFVSEDNGKNTSVNYSLQAGLDLHPRFRLLASYRQRTVGNANEAQQAKAQTFVVGFTAKPFPFLKIDAEIGNSSNQSTLQKSQAVAYQIATEWRLGAWQQLTLKHNQEAQTFTAGLINYKLFYKNYIANYSLNTPLRIGFYGQAIHSIFTDNNQRDLFFTSLYYDFSVQPVIKAGINYQYMTFKQRLPRVYFSPFRYHGVELFVQAENLTMPKQRLLYQVVAAIGKQKIENENPQSTYRLNASIGYRYKKSMEGLLYVSRSNSATTTALGYTYNELGMRVKWVIGK
jgi:tetratricopeptide (TPR) repeat protein